MWGWDVGPGCGADPRVWGWGCVGLPPMCGSDPHLWGRVAQMELLLVLWGDAVDSWWICGADVWV